MSLKVLDPAIGHHSMTLTTFCSKYGRNITVLKLMTDNSFYVLIDRKDKKVCSHNIYKGLVHQFRDICPLSVKLQPGRAPIIKDIQSKQKVS